jgi:hypothetical protein
MSRIFIHIQTAVEKHARMTEHDTAESLLGDFQAFPSPIVQRLKEVCPGGTWTRDSLCSFASIVGGMAGVNLERNIMKWKDLLIKWIADHFEILEPGFRFVICKADSFQ